nr:hypothetical protein [Siccibacter turicensis]
MHDLFMETIALQRIALFTRLVARGGCNCGEKDLALAWLDELTTDLEKRLYECAIKNPQSGGLSGGRGFQ